MSEMIIRMQDICKQYQMGDTVVRALDHASLTVRAGELVSIIGPSGSGKSTLMNIMGCLDTADSGYYALNGNPIEDYSEGELARIRSREIGFVFQSFNLIGSLTAEENVELPLIYQRVSRRERAARVEQALTRVQLLERRGHKPNELSGGQQQRVAIARAIAAQPHLFLADEPTGNLDSRTSDDIMKLFHELHAQGHTIVIITHNPDIAEQTERSYRMMDGVLTEVSAC